MKLRHMVCVCPLNDCNDRVLLIEKKRPTWQAGRLNLVGGKVEPNETILAAAQREFLEETGCTIDHIKEVGKISGRDFVVHFVVGVMHPMQQIIQVTDEHVAWYHWPLGEYNLSRMIPNLRIAIPMCMMGVEGWTIIVEGENPTYEYKVRVA
jgi:8-oxo-dGTP pyrophosphatase MutT (NUDIX family)